MAQINANIRMHETLEEEMLNGLALSSGSLLEDFHVMEVLQTTKESLLLVEERLEQAEQSGVRVSAARLEYKSVAVRGGLLYFSMAEAAGMNPMYSVSMQQFLVLFDRAVRVAEPATLTSKRVSNVIECLTYNATCYMQRAMYDERADEM